MDSVIPVCSKALKHVLTTINSGIEVRKIIPNRATLSVDF